MPQRPATVAQCAVVCSLCPSDDEDWTYCPHPSTRLCARRLLRDEEEEFPARPAELSPLLINFFSQMTI